MRESNAETRNADEIIKRGESCKTRSVGACGVWESNAETRNADEIVNEAKVAKHGVSARVGCGRATWRHETQMKS
ncbi:MAG: hypothetical protein LBN22_00420 [Clostridiales Family XIII bacterium]|nr:hypothetical protein [Clostridiales Family XIII bacterium]